MSGVPVFWRAQRHVRRRGATGAVALVGGAILTVGVVRAFDGPDTTVVAEIDGRTWLTTSGSDGPVLVLANGISGLVEGQVSGLDLRSTDVTFGGSDSRHTLLTTPTEVVLLADGRQTAATFAAARGSRTVIAEAGVVTAGDQVTVRRIVGDAALADPEVVPLEARPAPGAAPVVDAEGRAWVLVDAASGGRRVVPILADGTAGAMRDGGDATALAVVDGRALLRTATSMRPVGGGATLAVPGVGGAIPAVASATGGAWAVADGSRVALTGPDASTVELARPVTALAVWHGQVWAATDDELVQVVDGRPHRVEGVSGRARVFADGGRLWFVTPDVAAAIDREQQVTVFTLTSVDLSLCLGDCSAADATRVLDDGPTTTSTLAPDAASAPTTAPPISPPALLPTLPSTTTTVATTTVAPAPPTTVTVAATAASTTPAATVTVAPSAPPVTETIAPETIPITLPGPTDPLPTAPPPPLRTAPPATAPPTEPPTTTAPPLPPGRLVLGVDGGPGRATVTYGFDGVGEQCAGAGGDHTNGELSWSGVADGSELVELDLSSGAGRGSREFSRLPPGELTVTFRVCGELGSAAAVIEPDGTRPSVGALTFEPPAPTAGQVVTVSATLDTPPGWLCAGVTWVVDGVAAGARCRGSTVSHDITGLADGTHQVQVIVSFTRLIESTEATASGSVTVTATTTTTDSSTSVPGSDPPTSSSDPPTSSSDPPSSSSDPPTSSSDPPTSSSDPPSSSSDPPTSSSDPPASSEPPTSSTDPMPPPA